MSLLIFLAVLGITICITGIIIYSIKKGNYLKNVEVKILNVFQIKTEMQKKDKEKEANSPKESTSTNK